MAKRKSKSPVEVSLFQPHEEAAALIRNKPAVSKEVFDKLLPELRARAITVTGLEGLGAVERVRDEIASYARGQTADGEAVTWDKAKAEIVKTLDEAQFSPAAAERRATLLLRTHGFQAYQASNYRVGMESDDTTHWQYLATEDSHVRDSHLALNGLILPKNDIFWRTHFPPWEWGCRCRVAPMNPDMVMEELNLDRDRKPEDRLVVQGPALERLRQGQVVRGELQDRDGRTVGMGTHDVRPPSQKAGGSSFGWHPDDLRLRVDDLKARHEPKVWREFEGWAGGQEALPRLTVLEWTDGRKAPPPTLQAEEAHSRKLRHEVGVVFDAAGKQMVRRVGVGRSVAWTAEDRRLMHRAKISHNHPSGNGPTFDDYACAIRFSVGEFRVVTGSGVWVVKPSYPFSMEQGEAIWAALRQRLLEAQYEYMTSPGRAAEMLRQLVEADARYEVTFHS